MDKIKNQEIAEATVLPDNEIISRILTGEKNLYALLIRKYNQRLYRVGMSIINDDAEVEDTMQVAYIRAYENLGKFEFRSGFSTWLTRILINESLLRIKKRKSLAMKVEAVDNNMNQLSLPVSKTPLSGVINKELKTALEEAIRQLPEKYRTVFIMREIEDMNVAETQQCLDLTEANVKVRLNRAKAMLRDTLQNYYRNEDLLSFHLTRCDRVVENVMKQIEKL